MLSDDVYPHPLCRATAATMQPLTAFLISPLRLLQWDLSRPMYVLQYIHKLVCA